MTRTLIMLLLCTGFAGNESASSDVSSSEIPVIDFEAAAKKNFAITELMNDVRIVRLETNKQTLMNPSARFLTGDKFIVVFTQDKILQFKGDGSFVRVIAVRGKGPDEFEYARSFTMDKSESKLVIDVSNHKDVLLTYDLNAGAFTSRIPKPLKEAGVAAGFSVDQMLTTGDDQIYCVPESYYKGKFSVYKQSMSGTFLEGIPKEKLSIPRGYLNVMVPFLHLLDDKARFMNQDNDTLFTVSGAVKKPVAALSYDDKFIFDPNKPESRGTTMVLIGEGPSGMLFQQITGKAKIVTGGVSSDADWKSLYHVNKSNFKALVISGVQMDNLQIPLKQWQRCNDRVVLMINADVFKPLLRMAIDKSSANPEILARWKKMDQQVTINDNPVLIVGKLK